MKNLKQNMKIPLQYTNLALYILQSVFLFVSVGDR